VSALVEERLKKLEEAVATKGRMDGELAELRGWLTAAQDDIKKLSRPISHKQEEAKEMLTQAQVNRTTL